MNAYDILKYGNLTFLHTVEGIPDTAWEEPGVCGYWSCHDILRHLTSYEVMLVEILSTLLSPGPTPLQGQFTDPNGDFNDQQVAFRAGQSASETRHEYETAHAQALQLVAQFTPEKLREPGVLAWYGPDYSLDDFLVYTYYGHKREHAAQVNVYKDTLKPR